MEVYKIIHSLDLDLTVFTSLFRSFPREFVNWKPTSDKWNLLEIVNHLYDEEQYDFRARCKKILEQDKEWDSIDPAGWVKTRQYAEKDFNQSVHNFVDERKRSVEWLEKVKDKDWNTFVVHDKMGNIPAIKMLNLWLAHDILHIRQIIRLQWLYLEKDNDLGYAGDW
jgi:hypothetical protein